MRLLLGTLRAILGTTLAATVHTLGIKSAADDVITNAGKILDTAAADHNNAMLLQVVADAGNVRRDLVAVGEADTRDLTERGASG